MKKKTQEVSKHQLTTAAIKLKVKRWRQLEAKMAPLAEELKDIRDSLVADLDVKDALQFGPVTLRIMQGKSRKGLQWKGIAFGLAKRLFPTVQELRKWLRDLARKFPNQPTAAYARLFESKAEEN